MLEIQHLQAQYILIIIALVLKDIMAVMEIAQHVLWALIEILLTIQLKLALIAPLIRLRYIAHLFRSMIVYATQGII